MESRTGLGVWLVGAALLLLAAHPAQAQMLFIGDSVTSGIFGNPSFVDQLGGINAGCSGATTYDFLRAKRPDGMSHCAFDGAWEALVEPELPARFVHVMLGTNDANGTGEELPYVSIPEYRANLMLLISRLVYNGTRRIWLSVAPNECTDGDPFVMARIAAFQLVVHEIVFTEPRVSLGVDFRQAGIPTIDCVHPTEEGHAIMADMLQKRLPWLVNYNRASRRWKEHRS